MKKYFISILILLSQLSLIEKSFGDDNILKAQKIYDYGVGDGVIKANEIISSFALMVYLEDNDGENINREDIENVFSLSEKASDCINKNTDSSPREIALSCNKEISEYIGNTIVYLSSFKNDWGDMVESGAAKGLLLKK